MRLAFGSILHAPANREPKVLMMHHRCALAAYAYTNANGQPWTAARFPIGSPQLPMILALRCSRVWMHFLCAILYNKRGYVPCPNSAFYLSTSGVKTYQLRYEKMVFNMVLGNCRHVFRRDFGPHQYSVNQFWLYDVFTAKTTVLTDQKPQINSCYSRNSSKYIRLSIALRVKFW